MKNNKFKLLLLILIGSLAVLSFLFFSFKIFRDDIFFGEEIQRIMPPSPPAILDMVLADKIYSLVDISGTKERFDFASCRECFLDTRVEKQIYGGLLQHQSFMPVTGLILNGDVYPVMFSNHQGGAIYGLLKYFYKINLFKDGLFVASLLLFLLYLFFTFSIISIHCDNFERLIFLLFASVFPQSFVFGGPLYCEKVMSVLLVAIIWIYLKRTTNAFRIGHIVLAIAFWQTKTNIIMLLPLLLIFFTHEEIKKMIKEWSFFVIPFILLASLINYRLLFHEYVRASHFSKPLLFYFLGIKDFISLFIDPIQSLNYYYNYLPGLFPITYSDNASSIVTFRHLINFRLEPEVAIQFVLTGIYLTKVRTREMGIILLTLICVLLAAHMNLTFAPYLVPFSLLPIILIVVWWHRFHHKFKYVVIFIQLCLSIVTLFNFTQLAFASGPEISFSYEFYKKMSDELLIKKVKNPIMFYDPEFSMLETHSRGKIRPMYLREDKMVNGLSDLFKFFPKGHALIQVNPGWSALNWARDLDELKIEKIANQNGVELRIVHKFTYRNQITYYLVSFLNTRHSSFYSPELVIKANQELMSAGAHPYPEYR